MSRETTPLNEWKSPEAKEAAQGLRPGTPRFWEVWAASPLGERCPEIEQAILAAYPMKRPDDWPDLYLDGATRLRRAAAAANDLAFEIRAERARRQDEAVVLSTDGKGFAPGPDGLSSCRKRLRKMMIACQRWNGLWEPVYMLASRMDGLSEAVLRQSIDIGTDDDARFAEFALTLRRTSEFFRYLAHLWGRPRKRGRPLDVERTKLIRFARGRGYSLRDLAREIVKMGLSADGTPQPAVTVLSMRQKVDDKGRVVAITGRAVPNPEFFHEDGRPISEGAFQKALSDWTEEQTGILEGRLRSAENAQARGKRRRQGTGTRRPKETDKTI